MPTEELKDDAATYLMQTYSRQPISIARGRGAKVYDLEGREYIDFVGGIAVNVLGHGHPDLVQAIQRQAAQLIHTSNLYYTEPQVSSRVSWSTTRLPTACSSATAGPKRTKRRLSSHAAMGTSGMAPIGSK